MTTPTNSVFGSVLEEAAAVNETQSLAAAPSLAAPWSYQSWNGTGDIGLGATTAIRMKPVATLPTGEIVTFRVVNGPFAQVIPELRGGDGTFLRDLAPIKFDYSGQAINDLDVAVLADGTFVVAGVKSVLNSGSGSTATYYQEAFGYVYKPVYGVPGGWAGAAVAWPRGASWGSGNKVSVYDVRVEPGINGGFVASWKYEIRSSSGTTFVEGGIESGYFAPGALIGSYQEGVKSALATTTFPHAPQIVDLGTGGYITATQYHDGAANREKIFVQYTEPNAGVISNIPSVLDGPFYTPGHNTISATTWGGAMGACRP